MDAAGLQAVPINHVELTPEQFSPRVAHLLADGQADAERLNELVAVVRHQLERAGRYFDAGQEQMGLDATMGALYLVRAGEFRREMVQGVERTLITAAHAVARQGDEGRAQALYEMVQPELNDDETRADVAGHLKALGTWKRDTRKDGSMLDAGARRLGASKRALVWRTPDNLEEAQQKTLQWVERAFVVGREDQAPRSHDEFDERSEAHRAVMLGATAMTALYLRDGDAAGAVAALESEAMAAIANGRFVSRLNDAADGQPEAWGDMFAFFESSDETAIMQLDPDLARGAAWGAAVALYRAAPDRVTATIPIATLLVAHGLSDVAPLLLQKALGREPDARELSLAVRLMMQALLVAERYGDLELARQVFANGKGLVALAKQPKYAGRVRPTAADFHYTMGAMESRAGALDAARPHLLAAVEVKPSPQSLRLLAAIDRQRGDLGRALRSLDQMLKLVRNERDATSEAATQLMIYDLLRELGRGEEAAATLNAALERVLAARQSARTGADLAETERVLADVLERYGEASGAWRAVSRAGDAVRNDLRQLTATILDAARRALILSDLEEGRRAMRQALDADLVHEDLVYVALWVKLLHQRVGAASDGAYEEALARIESDGTWAATLREWARGNLGDEQLKTRASSVVERVEARFYVALSAHLRQAGAQTVEELQAVATSEAIELVEVRIARDFVLDSRGVTKPELPNGIKLP